VDLLRKNYFLMHRCNAQFVSSFIHLDTKIEGDYLLKLKKHLKQLMQESLKFSTIKWLMTGISLTQITSRKTKTRCKLTNN